MENEIHCPRCGSTQITANKKGFSGKKAAAGVLATGGIGLLAGTIGSAKILITCLNCGCQFKPGAKPQHAGANESKLIWDERLKKYIVNPKHKNSTVSAPLPLVLLIIAAIIIIIIYLIVR